MQTTAPDTSDDLRIVFAGTPEFAAIHLQSLLRTHSVIAVYTQPDRPAGRGKKVTESAVKIVAKENDIPVFQPESLKSAAAQQQLIDLRPDIFIVVAYGLILPQEVLDIPRYGCINVHGSLLPRWRGAAPIERALQAGDSETGVTIMRMAKGLDTGDMLIKSHCPINPTDTAASLHDRLAYIGTKALEDALYHLKNNTLNAQRQDDALATYAEKITKEEAEICWTDAANLIERNIRAYNPSAIAYSTIGDQRLKIWTARSVNETEQGQPGEIIALTKNSIVVACGQGAIELLKVQLPGGKAMEVQALLNSRRDLFSPGLKFEKSSTEQAR